MERQLGPDAEISMHKTLRQKGASRVHGTERELGDWHSESTQPLSSVHTGHLTSPTPHPDLVPFFLKTVKFVKENIEERLCELG